ncbi:kinase [Marinobacter vulgaris]|uniref:Kinase n=1 Tax=Marinobacter vulgaris TaxID=1928331 RepID=A0A2V3ZWE3_9GAMM|nr:kinase [Marinobacter vulgaris]PXX89772.1 kinase [Marinobacter vulgaris]TSJ68764.1 kinase [Marinobacter vulgaris]
MSQSEARFTVRSLIATAIGTIIVTVLVLEASGRIDHSDNKDHVPVGEFEAVHITPGEEFRMSPKSSELHAVCEQGYLAIAADVDPDFRGILVDYKNRGVRCSRGPAAGEEGQEPAGNE